MASNASRADGRERRDGRRGEPPDQPRDRVDDRRGGRPVDEVRGPLEPGLPVDAQPHQGRLQHEGHEHRAADEPSRDAHRLADPRNPAPWRPAASPRRRGRRSNRTPTAAPDRPATPTPAGSTRRSPSRAGPRRTAPAGRWLRRRRARPRGPPRTPSARAHQPEERARRDVQDPRPQREGHRPLRNRRGQQRPRVVHRCRRSPLAPHPPSSALPVSTRHTSRWMDAILGLALGFLVSVPPTGPVALLIVRRALQGLYRPGFWLGVGTSVADLPYIALGALGYGAILEADRGTRGGAQRRRDRGPGGRRDQLVRTPIAEAGPAETRRWGELVTGFVLGIANPTRLLTWTLVASLVDARSRGRPWPPGPLRCASGRCSGGPR